MRPLPEGHIARLEVQVTDEMTVQFDRLGPLHPVYATYQIARHFEEAGRLLLLPYLEPGEDAVGSALSVEHLASALPGMRVNITATLDSQDGRRLVASLKAVSELGDLIATGHTTQHVMSAQRLQERFAALQGRWAQQRPQEEGTP
ncbi:thioesterase family protein [Deinococcus sonorensis]|uniref:Thioesterase family protein n=2 Tax=Deinococcus sonorensis TaxID=309891 RepID=A0AAU7UD30_9DEIO